jgi:hypothetical protein
VIFGVAMGFKLLFYRERQAACKAVDAGSIPTPASSSSIACLPISGVKRREESPKNPPATSHDARFAVYGSAAWTSVLALFLKSLVRPRHPTRRIHVHTAVSCSRL